MNMIRRVTKLCLVEAGKPIFDERATEIEIVDECGGEFVEVSQSADDCGKIRIDPEEWPVLKSAIDLMIQDCRNYEENP